MTAIVWYRDDLRVSDHSALHTAARSHARSCVHLRARRQGAGHSAARRRDTMVAGAVVARLAGEPARAGRIARVAQGVCACGHRRARPRGRCRRGLLERDRAGAAPGDGRSGRRRAWRRSGSSTHRFPGDLLALAEPDPQQGEPGPARVHPVLAASAGAGRSAEAVACAEDAQGRSERRKRQAGRLEARADAAGLGRRAARHLAAWRGRRAGTAQGVSRRRHCRLLRRSRPARPRRHIVALAASSLRRNQSASGLARRALRRGRATSPVRRHRQSS